MNSDVQLTIDHGRTLVNRKLSGRTRTMIDTQWSGVLIQKSVESRYNENLTDLDIGGRAYFGGGTVCAVGH